MRTTFKADDALPAHAKRHAADTGTPLTPVVEDALREAFARRRGDHAVGDIGIPVFRRSRLLSGIDLDESAALLDRIEGSKTCHRCGRRPGPAMKLSRSSSRLLRCESDREQRRRIRLRMGVIQIGADGTHE
jgi:hypothetical protein